MWLGANDCILIYNPIKYYYEDLAFLFIDLKPKDKKVEQFYINFITVIEPFDDTIGFKKHIHKPVNSSKKSS